MLVVAALYVFVNLAYFYVLTPVEVASVSLNSSVATEVLRRFLGPVAVSLTASALMVSSFGSLHASVLANSRIPFAMARDGLFFKTLAQLSRNNVPARAKFVEGDIRNTARFTPIENAIAALNDQERGEWRQLIIKTCCEVMRDCDDQRVRADAYKVLLQLKVVKP